MSLTLADKVVYEEEIQKSRFIAKAAPVASEEEALAFLAENREPEATHNGHAYKIGLLYRFSDDGEPSGTAGRPILHAIEAQGLDRVAAEALRRAPKVPLVERVGLAFLVPFAEVGRVYALLEARALKAEETYTPEGVRFALLLPKPEREGFLRALLDATRGQVALE